MNKKGTLLISALLALFSFSNSGELLNGTGSISFTSSAPLETIKASSDKMKGIIDLTNKSFAFSIPVSTFEGFNSPLQKEHFNEHYMETSKYPKASFTGKMLEYKYCNENCEFDIIAKGKLTIHGITKVVAIPVHIKKVGKNLEVTTGFNVQLADYGIEIPLILEGKISPTIEVSVNSIFGEGSE